MPPKFAPGGEPAKNNFQYIEQIWADLNDYAMCRHSYVIVIGVVQPSTWLVLRLLQLTVDTSDTYPTTSLSQGDGGVGVKNGVNYFGKKNWVGTFAVPDAVVNDFSFLRSLPSSQKRAGFIEAVKVALIRDRSFFEQIEERADELANFETDAMEQVIRKSAAFTLIISPHQVTFEKGSAKPGFWSLGRP